MNSEAPNKNEPSTSNSAPDHFLSDENGITCFEDVIDLSGGNTLFTALKVSLLSFSVLVSIVRAFFMSFSENPFCGIIFSTSKVPSVMVPVLSRHIVSTRARVSIQ